MDVPGNGSLLVRLDERYKSIQETLERIESSLGNHGTRIGKLEIEQGKIETRQSLWAGLNSLGVVVAAALGLNPK